MSKQRTIYACTECGETSSKWQGQCPGCKSWNTLEERAVAANKPAKASNWAGRKTAVIDLSEANAAETPRYSSKDGELDRVLGGGFVPGSVLLVGGDPGIGKSTLLLQTCCRLTTDGARVLYVTGEESDSQVALRAQRMGLPTKGLRLMAETNLEEILEASATERPQLMIIDSIQTLSSDYIEAASGSVTQLRECAAQIVRMAKSSGITVVFIGHVTKDGQIAGPRLLEHMVDGVLYFEGDASGGRLLRAIKNRFGATGELGIYQMDSAGLVPVANPSALFLTERDKPVPGVCSFPSMEGNRPIVVEIQALQEPVPYAGTPARRCVGFDPGRLAMLLAILDNQLKLNFGASNIYINVVGGLRLVEPAADLAVAIALVSAALKKPVDHGTVAFGELGLTGEVRRVPFAAPRIAEAKRLGFGRSIGPAGSEASLTVKMASNLKGLSF